MLIIAEGGLNHNGDIELAKKLVNVAKWSGANAVKFQTFAEEGHKYPNITLDETIEVKEYCDKIGIMFLSSPHDYKAIDFLDDLVPIYKIASPFIVDEKFIRGIASKKKPVLMSTGSIIHKNGMATIKEIEYALSLLKGLDITLLHCISHYPCSDRQIHRIVDLRNRFELPVGISDHTKEMKLPRLPVIEKHIMLENVKCVDEDVSLTPSQFKQMVEYLRRCE